MIQHRPKKLQRVNFSKVKSVFKIREEVQNQNREFQNSIECFKSKQDIPNQDRMFKIRIGYSKLGYGVLNQNRLFQHLSTDPKNYKCKF